MSANVTIVAPPGEELAQVAARRLQEYLAAVTGEPVPVVADTEEAGGHGDRIVIGGPERNQQAAALGISVAWGDTRPDGYVLRTLCRGADTIVIAAGRTGAGDKYAVHHLIRELPVAGRALAFPKWDLRVSPFIKTREVIMGDACPWDPFAYADEVPADQAGRTYDLIWNTPAARLNCPDAKRPKVALRRILDKYCLENWPIARLEAYVAQMDAFGFNSAQFFDGTESFFHSGCLVTRRQWREKLLAMMARTHALGNRVSFLVWGAHVHRHNNQRVVSDWDDPLLDVPLVFDPHDYKASACWQVPEERRLIEAQLAYLAGYAPHVDHLISHFVDPGGCNRNGCTLGTCMAIMNAQFRTFRARQPRLTATFNAWPLTSDFAGYRTRDVCLPTSWSRTFSWWNLTQVADRLDPEIMVANRWYQPEVAAACRQWGRRYGLWCWYNCDQEITASLHVEAERLGREFGALPAAASEELEYVCVPANCHGLNAASHYLAGRLLWEPRRDPFELLREFCELVFGPRLAPAVYAGYHAIARIRNRDVDGDSAFSDFYLGAGTPDPAADARLAGTALTALAGATVDASWVSKLPLAVERSEMLADLQDHLRLVYQYAAFREVVRQLTRQDAIRPEDWARLPPVEPLRVSGGQIEWRKVADFLQCRP